MAELTNQKQLSEFRDIAGRVGRYKTPGTRQQHMPNNTRKDYWNCTKLGILCVSIRRYPE